MNIFHRAGAGLRCSSLVIVLSSLSIVLVATAALAGQIGSREIFQAAERSVGKEMWKGYGLPDGKLGCAAALCNVLSAAGVKGVHSPLVVVVRRQLLKLQGSRNLPKAAGSRPMAARELILRNGEGAEIDPAKLKDLARAGDVVLAFMYPPDRPNGGADAHCGIMGEGENIFTNDWNDGLWKQVNIHLMFDYYPYIRLLRLGG